MQPESGPEAARYAELEFNAPLSDDHAAALIGRLELAPGATVVDLGCGWGELLLRVLASTEAGCTGHAVDTNTEQLARGRAQATRRGLAHRVTFHDSPAEDWTAPADVGICIGAAHVWGGSEAALTALRRCIGPGGRLLYGDGCWPATPTARAAEMFGAEVLSLDALLDTADRAGWRVLHADVADQREWDDFESGWRRGQELWLAAHPDHPQASATRARLDARRREYVRDYRGVLGFAYLILA